MKKMIPVLKRIFPVTFFIFLLAAFFAYAFVSTTAESASSGSISTAAVQSGVTTTTSASLSTQVTTTRSLWVGEENTVIAVSLSDGQPGLYISTRHVEDIAVDNSRSVVWVGTRKEIIQYKFDGTENFWYPLKHGEHSHADGEKEGQKGGGKHCASGEKQNNSNNHKDWDDSDCEDSTVRISLDPYDGSLWIGAGRRVIKLSNDNRELFTVAGFHQITDISVDISDSSCWVGQKHKISKYSSDGTALLNIGMDEQNSVTALAADPVSHSLWIGKKNGVVKVDATGQEIFRIEEPVDIQDLTVNITNSSVWLVTKKKVYKYSKDGRKLFMVPLCSKDDGDDHNKENHAGQNSQVNPNCTDDDHDRDKDCEGDLVTLAVDSTDDTSWIASRKTLFKLNSNGDMVLRLRGYIQIQALDIGLPKIGITITEPQGGAVFTVSPITVRGIITDPTATVDVNGTKATLTNLDFEAKDILLSSGTNTITATAVNLARQKATHAIQVTYNPPPSGPTLLVCPEPYGEQRPHPPTPGCSQQVMLGDMHWDRGYVLGQVDDTVESVVVDGITLVQGGYIYNQGRILQAGWTDAFFWARMILSGPDGSYPVTTTVANEQGKTASATVTFIKDSVAPNIMITSPPDGTITNSQISTITGTMDDPTAVVRMDETGANIPVVNGVFTTQYDMGSVDGIRNIRINATDPALNTGYAYLTVTRDSTSPQIIVTSPADGTVTNSQTISIAGTVTDQNPGTITVAVNTGLAQPLTLAGTSFTGSATITNGINTLLFNAVDRAGNASTLSRIVTLDQEPPTAIVTGIEPNAVLTGTATVIVITTDSLSGIQSVTLLVDGIVKATLTQGPYTFNLDSFGLFAGNHTITIRVLDKAGNITEKIIPVTVSHQFGIQITSPTTGAIINKSTALIRGTINYPANQEIGVTVNGIPAEQQGSNFAAIVPLQQGQNTITATATNIYGVQEQATITINTDSIQDQIRFTTNPMSGIPMTKPDGTTSFDTTMNVETSLTTTIANYAYDTNGDGTPDQAGELLTQITATYQTPGLYFPTMTVTDTMGNTYSETAIVNVIDRSSIDTLLKAKWEGMKEALAAKNIQKAADYFLNQTQERYSGIFTALGDRLPQIVQGMQNISMVYLRSGVSKYRIRKIEPVGEVTYYIYFVKDGDGLWRIQQL